MTHTVETLMALAFSYAYKYADTCEVEQDCPGLRTARTVLRAALTEALAQHPLMSSMSWGGFNLYGDAESINKAKNMLHESDTVPALKQRIRDLQAAQPTAMPFVPWSKEAEMLESWTNKTVADTEILARGRFHAFKGEDGEPDDWEWFEAGTGCEDGCVDAVIVRADSIQAAQQVQASTDFHILSITTAYEQGVGKGHQAFKRGNDIENPYAAPSDCAKAWDYGYEEGKIQASRLGDKT